MEPTRRKGSTPRRAMDVVARVQKEISLLSGVVELLGWDMNTNMPPAAVKGRSEQLELVEGLIDERLRSTELAEAIREARRGPLSARDRVVIVRLAARHRRARRVPRELREEIARQRVLATAAWERARRADDFRVFAPRFAAMVELKRRQAASIDPRRRPYTVLLGEHEPGLAPERLDRAVATIKAAVLDLLQRIGQATGRRGPPLPEIVFRTGEPGRIVDRFLVETLRVPQRKVSLSESTHPFSTIISRNDVRITARRRPSLEALFDSVHEAGHALYNLGLPKEYLHTVVYEGASTGLHEAQALFFELFVCKSRAFFEGFHPICAPALEEPRSADELYRFANRLRPRAVRIDADELHYCLHLVLRHEFERDLFAGAFEARRAQGEWNARREALFGAPPRSDTEGILQDIHWADGDFGYFPSYLVGFAYAAQLAERLRRSLPFDDLVRNGELGPILDWLRRRVHNKGAMYPAEEVMTRATGRGLDAEALVRYLRDKYEALHDVHPSVPPGQPLRGRRGSKSLPPGPSASSV